MSIFTKILEKLGLRKEEEKPDKGDRSPSDVLAEKAKQLEKAGVSPPKRAKMSEVDVVRELERRAAETPQDLNWKTSIVDLLKLLNIDSSYEARRELALELNCPPDKMDDSAQMNTWLHKTVLRKIAENGGNVPRELLD